MCSIYCLSQGEDALIRGSPSFFRKGFIKGFVTWKTIFLVQTCTLMLDLSWKLPENVEFESDCVFVWPLCSHQTTRSPKTWGFERFPASWAATKPPFCVAPVHTGRRKYFCCAWFGNLEGNWRSAQHANVLARFKPSLQRSLPMLITAAHHTRCKLIIELMPLKWFWSFDVFPQKNHSRNALVRSEFWGVVLV